MARSPRKSGQPTESGLSSLLDRLKHAQREQILSAAQIPVLPPEGVIRKIADLEVAISAIEVLLEDDAGD